jgi:HlyD family secretion protein
VSERDELFRRVALERLSSPEQLDQLMVIVTPRRWLALVAMLALVVLCVVWSVVGRMPTHVEGQGLLIRTGGVQDIVAIDGGQVLELKVNVGDIVDKDAIVARISQPELRKEKERADAQLAELRIAQRALEQGGAESLRAKSTAVSVERQSIYSSVQSARAQVDALRAKERNQQGLLAQGLITAAALAATQREIAAAEADIRAGSVSASQTSVNILEDRARYDAEVQAGALRVSEAERSAAVLAERLDRATTVRSPFRGRVLELRAGRGDLLVPGTPLLNLDPMDAASGGDDLEVLLYVNAGAGKLVRQGMPVQVSPSTAKREEFGYLLGEVAFVADFPATVRGMTRTLGSEELAQNFLSAAQGAPLMIKAGLVRDRATPSGFSWSSGQGPPGRLTTGTPCAVSITVREQAPITLVIPALTRLLGG